MNHRLSLLGIAMLPLALAACQGEKKSSASAQGRILPGSVSDAMLPFDTLRSQPPLASPPASPAQSGAAGEAAGEGGEAAGEGKVDSTASEAQASQPSAPASPSATPDAR